MVSDRLKKITPVFELESGLTNASPAMSDLVRVHCEIPLLWKSKLERLAAERKIAPTDLMREAIACHLGEAIGPHTARLDTLEAEVAALWGAVQSLTRPIPTPPQMLTPFPSHPALTEDGEDEPDEVLYDFLEGEH